MNIFSRKYNSIIEDAKSSRGKSQVNRYTIKQIKICTKKENRNNIKILKKIFEGKRLPHELFLTATQTIKINVFTNNMPTDVKLKKAQKLRKAQI